MDVKAERQPVTLNDNVLVFLSHAVLHIAVENVSSECLYCRWNKRNQATPEIHVLIKELSVWAAGLLALFHTETARSQRHWSGLSLCSWRFNSGFLTRCCSVCSHRTHFIISSSLIKSISLSCWYTCPHLWLITSSASFKWTHHSSTDNS